MTFTAFGTWLKWFARFRSSSTKKDQGKGEQFLTNQEEEQKRNPPSEHRLDIPDQQWIETFRTLSEIPFQRVDRGTALKKITDLVKQVMGSHACTLVLVDLDRKVLTQTAGTGPNDESERFMDKREVQLGSVQDDGASMDFELIKAGNPVARYNLEQDGKGIANKEMARKYGLSAGLCYPLKSRGRLLGYLNHFLDHSRPFTQDEEHLLGIFANQAVNVIERFDQQRIQERMLILRGLSQSLLDLPLDRFFAEVPRKACELLDVLTCIVWQLNEEKTSLDIVAATDDVDAAYRKISLDIHESGITNHLTSLQPGSLTDVTRHHPSFYKHAEEAKSRGWVSLLSSPMHVNNQLVGMLDVYTKHRRAFGPEEKALFADFANHAAIAIQKAEFLQETDLLHKGQQLAEKLQLVAESELPKVLQRVTEMCANALGAEACYLRLWDKIKDNLELKAAFPDGNEEMAGSWEKYSLDIGEGIAGAVAEEGKSIICGDTERDRRYKKEKHVGDPLISVLCVPIKSGEEIIGTLIAGSRRHNAFRLHDQRFLENVIGSISIVIERTHLMDSLGHLAKATIQAASVQELLDEVAEQTRALMRMPICLVSMIDKDNDGFRPRAFAGPGEQRETAKNLFFNKKLIEEPFLKREYPAYSLDATKLSRNPHKDTLAALEWKSVLAYALHVEGRAVGYIELYSYKRERKFTLFQRELFKTFTEQAAIAIGHQLNRDRARKQDKITQAIEQISDPDELLETFFRESLALVESSRGWISRLNPQTGARHIVKSEGNLLNPEPLLPGEGITGKSLSDEAPIRVDDVRTPTWDGVYKLKWENTRSELAVPIVAQNTLVRIGNTLQSRSMPIGVLNIESPTTAAFSQADMETLWQLARHVAVVWGKLEFDRKLTGLSDTERRIVSIKDGDEVIRVVARDMRKILGLEYVIVSRLEPETQRLSIEYTDGVPEHELAALRKSLGSPSRQAEQAAVIRARDIFVVPPPDPPALSRSPHTVFGRDAIKIYAPLTSTQENRVIGILEAGCRREYEKLIYERDVQLLARFAACIGRALEQGDRGLLEQLHHEFTAPIAGIRNNVNYLQHRLPNLSDEYVQVKFDDMLLDCEILLHQVEELEFILGKSARKPDIQEILVFRDIIIKTINQLKPLVVGRGFDFAKVYYRPSDAHRIRIRADRSRLNQVVYNLLVNAIKYAEDDPASFAIRVLAEETRDVFTIQFKDWGIGIQKGCEARIFQKGFRTPEALQREVAGSGLGLTIARDIMWGMGGDIVLVNRYKPTEFHVIIPKSLKEKP